MSKTPTRHVQVKVVSPHLKHIPEYATAGSAGLDMTAAIDNEITIGAGETKLIPLGIALHIHDTNMCAKLYARSGLANKLGIKLANGTGLIDSDYQGELKASIWNTSSTWFTIHPGDAICQMVFEPVYRVVLEQVDEFLMETDRGKGGFGHTGGVKAMQELETA
jgi:dUTP pyrophosphatase